MANSVPFIDSLFRETLDLLEEARAYAGHGEVRDIAEAGGDRKLQMNLEAMRITSRLTQVMAWIMGQKAAAQGEITPSEAASALFFPGAKATCLAAPVIPVDEMPIALADLYRRSLSLYSRVQRLATQTSQSASEIV